VQSRAIVTPGVTSLSNGIAVSRDGSTLLVSDYNGGSHSISVYNVADGVRTKVFGGPAAGSGPLQLNRPGQVWIADDGVVFVADCGNHRVQVLAPGLDACSSSLGAPPGTLNGPVGVCANADIVVVSEVTAHRLTVLKRSDGSVVRRMGCEGSGDGQLKQPHGVCFMSGGSHVAVADYVNNRVCVFGVDGTFVRHIGVGVLKTPTGITCSALDELVVADTGGGRVRLFSAAGALLKTFGVIHVSGVAIHESTIFAQDHTRKKCLLYV
jgi:DNA-binding beta-propeller fold protein YncE